MTETNASLAYDPLSKDARADSEVFWKDLRTSCPVHHHVLPQSEVDKINANPLAAEPTTEFWTLLRYDDVTNVLSNPQKFPSGQGPGPERMHQSDDSQVLLFADGETHLRQRRLAAKAFTPRAVELLRPRIQKIVDDLIDQHADGGELEVMEDIGVPLAMRTILQIMGMSEERVDDIQRWGMAINSTFGGDVEALAAGGAALMELFGYIKTLTDRIRAGEAEPDLDSGVLAALVRADYRGTTLSDPEIQSITMQLIIAGYETTSTALTNAVYELVTRPEQRALFETADPDGVNLAVEEVLRYVGPMAGLFRTTTEDVELSGCPIPAGAKVRVAFASANRDDEVFSDASEFRIDRDPAELRNHIAFGVGPHACIGAALARAELRIALETLFRRLPGFELDPNHPPRRNDVRMTILGYSSLNIRWDPEKVRPAVPLSV